MLLYEFEGIELFKRSGINVPPLKYIKSADELDVSVTLRMLRGAFLKAQILSGNRAEHGGIVRVEDGKLILQKVKDLLGQKINGQVLEGLLVEEPIDVDKEYYLSFSYSTETRSPVLTFGEGGTGVEDKQAQVYPIDPLNITLPSTIVERYVIFEDVIIKLWEVFTKYDCELAEINPLVVDKQGKVWALDAKVILDDDADFRREEKFPQRNLFGRGSTEAEIEARKIDEGDHRGTAGSVYWDLGGDIAVIAAGGGGSIVNMDALISLGGKPANYTEHSGNPPREKLKKLTKIVLAKPDLKGCWFVGGTANFTDIYETLMGFVEGLREVSPKPNYPIVIRRGGPNDKKAFEELKEIGKKEGFDFHIFGRETPMTQTAKTMVDLAYGKESK